MRHAPPIPLPGRLVRTERLTLVPPGKENLPDLMRLKSDPRVFELMLHGVRSEDRVRDELEDDIEFWRVRGYGTWCVWLTETGEFLGIAGLMERPDGRGVAMRFALWPECRGKGLCAGSGEGRRSISATGPGSTASSPSPGWRTWHPAPCCRISAWWNAMPSPTGIAG